MARAPFANATRYSMCVGKQVLFARHGAQAVVMADGAGALSALTRNYGMKEVQCRSALHPTKLRRVSCRAGRLKACV
jgi:hypothetical protein